MALILRVAPGVTTEDDELDFELAYQRATGARASTALPSTTTLRPRIPAVGRAPAPRSYAVALVLSVAARLALVRAAERSRQRGRQIFEDEPVEEVTRLQPE